MLITGIREIFPNPNISVKVVVMLVCLIEKKITPCQDGFTRGKLSNQFTALAEVKCGEVISGHVTVMA